jgi:hypothetical protein
VLNVVSTQKKGGPTVAPDGSEIDLKILERLLTEAERHAQDPDGRQRLIHSLHNLAHATSLLATVLKDDRNTVVLPADDGVVSDGVLE